MLLDSNTPITTIVNNFKEITIYGTYDRRQDLMGTYDTKKERDAVCLFENIEKIDVNCVVKISPPDSIRVYYICYNAFNNANKTLVSSFLNKYEYSLQNKEKIEARKLLLSKLSKEDIKLLNIELTFEETTTVNIRELEKRYDKLADDFCVNLADSQIDGLIATDYNILYDKYSGYFTNIINTKKVKSTGIVDCLLYVVNDNEYADNSFQAAARRLLERIADCQKDKRIKNAWDNILKQYASYFNTAPNSNATLFNLKFILGDPKAPSDLKDKASLLIYEIEHLSTKIER